MTNIADKENVYNGYERHQVITINNNPNKYTDEDDLIGLYIFSVLSNLKNDNSLQSSENAIPDKLLSQMVSDEELLKILEISSKSSSDILDGKELLPLMFGFAVSFDEDYYPRIHEIMTRIKNYSDDYYRVFNQMDFYDDDNFIFDDFPLVDENRFERAKGLIVIKKDELNYIISGGSSQHLVSVKKRPLVRKWDYVCDCLDYEYARKMCKHVIAVKLKNGEEINV